MNNEARMKQAKRAYELGRLRSAARVLFLIVPLALFSMFTSTNVFFASLTGSILAGAAIAFLWRGQTLGHGVMPGIWAGVLAFTMHFAADAAGLPHKGLIGSAVCLASGLMGGIVLGVLLTKRHTLSRISLGIGIGIATLVTVLGCAPLGPSVLFHVVLALAITGFSFLLLSRAQ